MDGGWRLIRDPAKIRSLLLLAALPLLLAGCDKKSASIVGAWHTGPRSGNSAYVFAQDGSFAIAGKGNAVGGNMEGRYQQLNGAILLLGQDPDVPTKHQDVLKILYKWINENEIYVSSNQGKDAEQLMRVGAAPATTSVDLVMGINRKTKMALDEGIGTPDGDCKINMKSLTRAMLMYVQDNDDTFPDAGHCYEALLPYVKRKDAFTCPALKAVGQHGGYGMNGDISGKKFATVGAPEGVLSIFEAKTPAFVGVDPLTAEITTGRHKHIWQGFADGHISAK